MASSTFNFDVCPDISEAVDLALATGVQQGTMEDTHNNDVLDMEALVNFQDFEPQYQIEPELQHQPELEPEPELELEPEFESEPELEFESEPEFEPELEFESEPEFEPELELEPEQQQQLEQEQQEQQQLAKQPKQLPHEKQQYSFDVQFKGLQMMLGPQKTPETQWELVLMCLPEYPAVFKPDCIDYEARVAIMALGVHPMREASLHVLNGDTHSAEICMQKTLNIEGFRSPELMLLRAIVARADGEFTESCGWYQEIYAAQILAKAWPWGEIGYGKDRTNTIVRIHRQLEKELKKPQDKKDFEWLGDIEQAFKYEWSVFFRRNEKRYQPTAVAQPLSPQLQDTLAFQMAQLLQASAQQQLQELTPEQQVIAHQQMVAQQRAIAQKHLTVQYELMVHHQQLQSEQYAFHQHQMGHQYQGMFPEGIPQQFMMVPQHPMMPQELEGYGMQADDGDTCRSVSGY
ncbi:hypothetical protein TWF281_000498 [Arthrobotrys megalospora]